MKTSYLIIFTFLAAFACDDQKETEPKRSIAPASSIQTIDTFNSKTVSFTSSAGVLSEFTYLIEEDWQPTGLLVFLHGSGNAAGYKGNFAKVATAGKTHNLKAVVVKSASTDSWYKGAEINLPYFKEAMEKISEETGLDKSRVYFAGVSGGAVFLSAYFIPSYGYLYTGGAVNLCGGERSLLGEPGGSMEVNEAMRSGFGLYYLTQTGDYMLDQVKRAETFYSTHGLRVIAEYPSGEGHCGFDMLSALIAGISKLQ